MLYFFHLEDGTCIHDPEGEEFPNNAAALIAAAKLAHDLRALRIHPNEWRVVVKNADGLRIGSVPIVPDPSAIDPTAPDLPIPSMH